MSETSSAREYLQRFCQGKVGLDLGFGGDPIRYDAITIDLNPITRPTIIGDASKLHWFSDDSVDFVYSSHLLEDFDDVGAVLDEWMRVLKPWGNLVLFLPDQKSYVAHCKQHGVTPNQDHKHAGFGLKYVLLQLGKYVENVVHVESPVTYNPYSFALVVKKPLTIAVNTP